MNSGASCIQGILLAAGCGRRFDPDGNKDKLLQTLADGHSVLWHSASALLAAVGNCLAVIRPEQLAHRQLLEQLGCEVLVNAAAADGMGTSLSLAVRASAEADCWVVALADMPWIEPTISARVAAAVDGADVVAAPFCQSQRGHPVAFGRNWLSALVSLSGDQGARQLLRTIEIRRVEPAPPSVLRDVDLPADLDIVA